MATCCAHAIPAARHNMKLFVQMYMARVCKDLSIETPNTPDNIDFVVQYLALHGDTIPIDTPEFIESFQAAMQSMCDTVSAKISQRKKVINAIAAQQQDIDDQIDASISLSELEKTIAHSLNNKLQLEKLQRICTEHGLEFREFDSTVEPDHL